MILKYIVPSRIAINLYDMNGALGRVDGGMGFSLEYPRLVFKISLSENFQIESKEKMSNEIKQDIEESVNKLKDLFGFKENINLIIEESIPEHSGFGSKTATLLSISHAYCKLYDKEISYIKLGEILRRGGTSGLGINLIDKGGFILEGGHSTKYKKLFQPSSSVKKVTAAPILARYECNWNLLLIVPKTKRIFGEKERNFFDKICPIKEDDIEKLARITLSVSLPSVIEDNLGEFCKGINLIQERTWKKSEIKLYNNQISDLMSNIKSIDSSLGVGMSSIGPVIYIFGNNLEKIANNLDNEKFEIIKLTKINNKGIQITKVEE